MGSEPPWLFRPYETHFAAFVFSLLQGATPQLLMRSPAGAWPRQDCLAVVDRFLVPDARSVLRQVAEQDFLVLV